MKKRKKKGNNDNTENADKKITTKKRITSSKKKLYELRKITEKGEFFKIVFKNTTKQSIAGFTSSYFELFFVQTKPPPKSQLHCNVLNAYRLLGIFFYYRKPALIWGFGVTETFSNISSLWPSITEDTGSRKIVLLIRSIRNLRVLSTRR